MDYIYAQQNDTCDHLIKILALGDSAVGKTAFLHRYAEGVFIEKFVSTIGIDYIGKELLYKGNSKTCDEDDDDEYGANTRGPHNNGANAKAQRIYLKLWDTAGQERFRCLTTSFFRDANGFLLMFDVTQELTYVNIRSWLNELNEQNIGDDTPIVLVGNKIDLAEEIMVTNEAAIKLAESLGFRYFETSALSGENVTEAIEALLELIMLQIEDEKASAIPVVDDILVKTGCRLHEGDDVDEMRYCAC